MANQIHLKKSLHDLLWKRKDAMEAKFTVKINRGYSFSQKHDTKNGCDDSSRGEICVDFVLGGNSDIEALKKYVDEVFAKPEIIDFVSYHQGLEPVFQNDVWIDIFEEIFSVCISTKPDCELNIAGTESSVTSAVTAFEELMAKYHECKDTLVPNSEKSLAQKLVAALTACKDVYVPATIFEVIPNGVLKLLLSLLEKAYKESFPVCDESESLEDSVMVIDPPEKKDASVIVLDSDSNSDSNSKRPLESGSSEKISKKKKKRLRERKMKKKRSRALENMNGLQGGGDLPDQSERENGNLQCPKIENCVDRSKLPKIEDPNFIPLGLDSNCVDRSKLPKIENPNFIPLGLDSANANTSTSETPPQQAAELPGPVQMKNEEVEVIEEPIPEVPRQLRPVIIDGCNVAFYATQGRREDFSWKRIEISLNYFLNRGHDVKVFLPQYRRPLCYEKSGNQDHVENLETKHQIIFTPSRRIDGRTVSCYDDRFIVDLASRNGGIIFSNDNYRDLINENPDFAKTIKERLLMYVFVGDELMIPNDPLGKNGPRLDEFLSFPPEK